MLYFWITNASRAHRAGRSDGSGKNTPSSCNGKKLFRKGRKRELSEPPVIFASEPQLDKILQKNTPSSSLNGSNSHVATPNGTVDVPWIKSRYEGMPMITSLANMTQIQGDVKNTEAEIYTNLLLNYLEQEKQRQDNKKYN